MRFQVIEAVLKKPVTRIPLWRGTPENIIGILHVRDPLRGVNAAAGDSPQGGHHGERPFDARETPAIQVPLILPAPQGRCYEFRSPLP